MHIVIVAGEASGDILGAGLIKALKLHHPEATFSGVGGERMLAEGFHSLFALDRLSVMGFIEPLKRLPELLHIRKSIKQHIVSTNAVAFIGIDSPDFNLNLEAFAKARGVAAIHYVSLSFPLPLLLACLSCTLASLASLASSAFYAFSAFPLKALKRLETLWTLLEPSRTF